MDLQYATFLSPLKGTTSPLKNIFTTKIFKGFNFDSWNLV